MYILIINVIKEIKDMKKKSNKKGFTIMEMLIVVAIIAVLAAIAIPTMTSALTKSKEAADVANIRAAYAEVQVQVLTEGIGTSDTYKTLVEAKVNDKLNYSTKLAWSKTKEDNDTMTYTPDKLKPTKGENYKWVFGDVDTTD